MPTIPVISNVDRILDISPAVATADFSISWPVIADTETQAKDDLIVLLDGVQLSTSAYEFLGNPIQGVPGVWNGGTVRLDSSVSGIRVIIYSARAPRRTGNFLGECSDPMIAFDAMLNDLAAMIRDVHLGLKRSIRFPVEDVADDISPEMLDPWTARAGKYFAFAADGSPSISAGTGNDSALRTDLAAAAIGVGDALLTVRRNLTGASSLTLHDWIEKRAPHPYEFGAVGNGSANDTRAMQAWAGAAGADRNLYAPRGTFLTDTVTLLAASSYTHIRGAGMDLTTFQLRTAGQDLFAIPVGAHAHSLVIENCTLKGAGTSRLSGSGVHFPSSMSVQPFNGSFRNVRIQDFGRSGIFDENGVFSLILDNVQGGSCGDHFLDLMGGPGLTLLNCYPQTIAANKYGFRVHQGHPLFLGCNGINGSSGAGSGWGLFSDTVSEDGALRYCEPVLVGCNVEDFKSIGLRNKNTGIHVREGTKFLAPPTGTVTAIRFDTDVNHQGSLWDYGQITSKGANWADSLPIHNGGSEPPFLHVGQKQGGTWLFRDFVARRNVTCPAIGLQRTPGTFTVSQYISDLKADTLRFVPTTVANLPSAFPAHQRRMVTDANARTFGLVVAGGGANVVPVYSDGTNWRIG